MKAKTPLLLFALALVAYLPAMRGQPIWDDVRFVFENPLLDGDLGRIWFSTENNDYWPLSYTWFWILHRIFGDATLPYHLGNVLLHATNAVLIERILRKLNCAHPILPAIAFVLHPVNVEAVAWMFQAKTLLASAFAFASCLAFLRWEEHGARRDLVLLLLAFTAAMLSKSSAAMFPLVFLLSSLWRNEGRATRRAWIAIVPSLAIAAVLGLIAIRFHRIHYLPVRDDPMLERILGATWALWFYLHKTVLPVNLSFVYPLWEIDRASVLAWLPLAAAIALAIVAWKIRPARFALAFFALNLVPVLGFIDIPFMQFSLVADHWQYPAIAGPLALLSPLAERLGRARLPVSAAIAASLLALTAMRASLFSDEIPLYRDAVAKSPDNFMVRINLGRALAAKKELDAAIAEFEEAVRIAPKAPDARYNLGAALAEKGQPIEASQHLRQALALDPSHVEANYTLGNLLLAINRYEDAATHFTKALEREPDHLEARTNLGAALASIGRYEEARTHLERAVTLAPQNVELMLTLARVQANAGDLAGAEATARRAMSIDPDAYGPKLFLGVLAARVQRTEEARRYYEEALRTAPPDLGAQIRAAIDALNRPKP